MELIDVFKQANTKVYTENNDTAYSTTFNANLDFFGLAGASRYNQKQVLELFERAFDEDKVLAMMNLLYLRDIRYGLGERDSFRTCFKWLCIHYPHYAKILLRYIPSYGRWDDCLVALHTPVENIAVQKIYVQLIRDLDSKENDVSLVSKWLPSINASSEKTRNQAKYLCKKMQMSYADYRKTLSKLRNGRIIENNLREKDYSFVYAKVCGGAMHKYRQAFIKNDFERYESYLSSVKRGESQIHSNTLYPYQIIKEFEYGMSEAEKDAMQIKWDNYPKIETDKNTIVVRDGSGSMTWPDNKPYDIATSLSILFSEQLKGQFKNKFITFSSNPKLVELQGNLYDKLMQVRQYRDMSNTNIEKVYDLILEAVSKVDYNKENQIDRIVIISDMEFDCGVCGIPTFETFEKKFNALGYSLPEIVYWNVNARSVHFAAMAKNPKIRFVSGSSANVLQNILNNSEIDSAEDFMLKTLSPYAFLKDEL